MDANEETPRCGAKTKSGEPCKRRPAKGRTRCKLHGGATPVGQQIGNQNASSHGIYSREFSPEELELLPELCQRAADLTDEINLVRITLRRVWALDNAIESGEVQVGMQVTEMRRVVKQRMASPGTNEEGRPQPPVMVNDGTEDHIVRKLPDTKDLIHKMTGRLQGLVKTMQEVHTEQLEELKFRLIKRIGEVEEEHRRLKQFGVVQGGRQA